MSGPLERTRAKHFVHGFLESVEGIDFGRRVRMGIRNNRYEAMVPTVTGALRRRGSVHAADALIARTHTTRGLKFTLPGPMTIVDTIADEHYRDRIALAMAFAELLNEEARELAAIGVDVIQFDEPAFNVYLDEVVSWGIDALRRAAEGLACKTAVHICYGYGIQAEAEPRCRMAAIRADLPGIGGEPDRPGLARMRQLARAIGAVVTAWRQGRAGRRDRCCEHRGGNAGAGRGVRSKRSCASCRRSGAIPAPTAGWRPWTAPSPNRSSPRSPPAPRSSAAGNLS